jgi:hypothetical protein
MDIQDVLLAGPVLACHNGSRLHRSVYSSPWLLAGVPDDFLLLADVGVLLLKV